jgi:hypothetical protein
MNTQDTGSSSEHEQSSDGETLSRVVVVVLLVVVAYMGWNMVSGPTRAPLQPGSSPTPTAGIDSTVTDSTGSDSTSSDSTGSSETQSTQTADQSDADQSDAEAPENGPATAGTSTPAGRNTSGATGRNSGPGGTPDRPDLEPDGTTGEVGTERISNPGAAASADEKISETIEELSGILEEEIARNPELEDEAITIITDGPEAIRDEISIATGESRLDRFDDLILKYARLYQVDPLLIKAVMRVESNMDPKARNPRSTAAGLTQVVSDTYRLVHPKEKALSNAQIEQRLMDPEKAIETGVRYLAKVKGATNGNPRQMAFYYFLGHKAPEQLVRGGLTGYLRDYIGDANTYAEKVMSHYEKWSAQVGYEAPDWI